MGASMAEPADHWVMDNPVSRRWPLYTRGNVGEVFPEVVLPFTWDALRPAGRARLARRVRPVRASSRAATSRRRGMVILGVFGGYCYINAS